MNNDPMSYLGGFASTGIKKGAERLKVKTVTMAVKRPPEMNVSAGPGKGLGEGNRPIKGTGEKRYGPPPKGVMNGDGWTAKKNTPSRVGPETGPSQGFETAGSNKARAAGKRGVETQSPKVEKGKGLAKRANIEGNESKKYEALEKKSMRALKGGGTEKELRAGHNEKSMKPGGGGRFAKLKASISKKGGVKDPGAVAAAIGRKKYGAEKMAKWSAAGRKKG